MRRVQMLKQLTTNIAGFVKGVRFLATISTKEDSNSLMKKVFSRKASKLLGSILLTSVGTALFATGFTIGAFWLVAFILGGFTQLASYVVPILLGLSGLFGSLAYLLAKYNPELVRFIFFYLLDSAIIAEDRGQFSLLYKMGVEKGFLPDKEDGDYYQELILARRATLHIMLMMPSAAREYPAATGPLNPGAIFSLLKLGATADESLLNILLEDNPSELLR